MDEELNTSWERALHPETLKSSIITASIFSMAFEMLKKSITQKIEMFFSKGFDKDGWIISTEYKSEVLSLNKSPLYASLNWLRNMDAIDENDLVEFDRIKKCRNTLVHEMLEFASTGVDFDTDKVFNDMVSLLRKIEMWWFVNFEMEISPESYPDDLDLDEVLPGPVWSLKMLIDVALGPEEEARKYYDHFVKSREGKAQ